MVVGQRHVPHSHVGLLVHSGDAQVRCFPHLQRPYVHVHVLRTCTGKRFHSPACLRGLILTLKPATIRQSVGVLMERRKTPTCRSKKAHV
jgi:hypothetical protein